MGTRGACGFIVDGKHKVNYNHFDSYPSGLGATVYNLVCAVTNEQLAEGARNIELVDGRGNASARQIRFVKDAFPHVVNTGVSEQRIDEWYCLLREAQGQPGYYVPGYKISTRTGEIAVTQPLRYMEDGAAFLLNSLFCEWAYIINIDNGTLECYGGFNRGNGVGRYAKCFCANQPMDGNRYYGVSLIADIPLDEVRQMSEEDFVKMLVENEDKLDGSPSSPTDVVAMDPNEIGDMDVLLVPSAA